MLDQNNFERMGNLSKLSDYKTVSKSLSQLQKWREDINQRFQNRQMSEYQNALKLCGEKKKDFEKLIENSQTDASALDTSLQDSSLTGHIMRCFNDSSQNSLLLKKDKDSTSTINDFLQPEIKKYRNIQVNHVKENSSTTTSSTTSVKPKRPFLRKKSGLQRYMGNQKRQGSTVKYLPTDNNKPQSQEAPRSEITHRPPTRSRERVQFSNPVVMSDRVSEEKSLRQFSDDRPHVIESEENILGQRSEENIPCSDDSFNMEKHELAEFEMLENCAQNSSFNSDSSVVQRVLKGEPLHVSEISHPVTKSKTTIDNQYKNPVKMSITSAKLQLGKFVEELQSRKQQVHVLMSETVPQIASLQREISGSPDDRASTPLEDPKPNVDAGAYSDDDEGSHNLPSHTVELAPQDDNDDESLLAVRVTSAFQKDVQKTITEPMLSNEKMEKKAAVTSNNEYIGNSVLKEKMAELEKEIQIYQENNSHLLTIRKERDEILKKLKKEQNDFQKYKEEEIKNIKTEIENERKQIKREKETFTRLQKSHKDNPSRKEREEILMLRQEVEELKREVKKQKIRFTNDSRRMKNLQVNAEKDRDILKLENIRLQDECKDLLETLKALKTKRRKSALATDNAAEAEDVPFILKLDQCLQTDETTNENLYSVRFNLTPEFENETPLQNSPVNGHSSPDSDKPAHSPQLAGALSEERGYEEILHDDKIVRIYISGDRELIFPSGTKKYISADGAITKTTFYNGDVREIFADNTEIYHYTNGVVEKLLCCGLIITEFPDGQVQRTHPDGLKEVRFLDGTTHHIYPDGSEEIRTPEGNISKLDVDGTETVEHKNGEKEIRTANCKRREYPDGSVKIIYDSGRQETRYSNGRIRIKDKDGKLVVDTKHLTSW